MKREYEFDVPVSRSAPALLRRISWGAVFAGVTITLAVQVVLSLLGLGIGASTVDPLHDHDPGKGVAIGAAIWFVISSILATYAGAWVAGRLSGLPRPIDGTLHGLLTWGAATLLTVFLLTTAVGSVIGGAANLLGKALPAAGKAAQSGDLQSQLQQMGVDTGQVKQRAQAAMPEGVLPPTGRTQSEPEQAQQQKAQLEQKARETGDAAARGVAHAAFWSFVILVLSAGASAYGGRSGTPLIRYPTTATVENVPLA